MTTKDAGGNKIKQDGNTGKKRSARAAPAPQWRRQQAAAGGSRASCRPAGLAGRLPLGCGMRLAGLLRVQGGTAGQEGDAGSAGQEGNAGAAASGEAGSAARMAWWRRVERPAVWSGLC